MRYFEMPGRVKTDRALIDMREARDDLSIRISLLKDGGRIAPGVLSTMQRKLRLLDFRIAEHKGPICA
jgi:hypothetical protein